RGRRRREPQPGWKRRCAARSRERARRAPARPPAGGRRRCRARALRRYRSRRRESLSKRARAPTPAPDGSARQSRRPARSLLRLRDGGLSEPSEHTVQSNVVRQIRSMLARAELLEMGIFELPGRVVLRERHRVLRRTPARQQAATQGERRRTPLAQRADVSRALFGEQIAGEMVAPAEQRHFQFELWLGRMRGKHDMVGRAIFEAAARYDTNILADIAEPELRGV